MRQNLRIFEFDAQKETWAGATSPQNIKLLFLELQVVREGALIHNLKPSHSIMPGLLESCGNGGIDYKPFIKNPERQNPDEENQGLSNPCSAQTYVSLKRSTWRSDVLNDMRFLFSVGSSRMRDAYCHLKHISIIQKEFQVHYTALKVHDNQIIQHSNQWHLLLFHFRFDLSGPTGQHCWLQSQCLKMITTRTRTMEQRALLCWGGGISGLMVKIDLVDYKNRSRI